MPDRGELWRRATSQVPVDGWLLQGERYDYGFSSSVVLSIFPGESICARNLAALLLYQSMILLEATAKGSDYDGYNEKRERSLSLSLSLSRELSKETKSTLGEVFNFLDKETRSVPALVSIPLSQFGLRSAALDWFNDQASDPDLANRRGMPSGEPLPRQFDLFDSEGRPHLVQKRSSWLTLRHWLDDDEAILRFAFPEGLDDEDRQIILSDLEILRRQPWSPQAGIAAMLKDWPEAEEERDISLEDADQRLRQACEQALKEMDD